METDNSFAAIASLICEPARALILWTLLDGKASTAGELALAAGISPTSASNHLARLQEADLVKAEAQGRHRYYSFSRPEVAYVIESLASLSVDGRNPKPVSLVNSPVKYCRTCYDHLAGYTGVLLTERLERKRLIRKTGTVYHVTGIGWDWFADLGIHKEDFLKARRPLTRQCLDWSERRPHLAGSLGAALLSKMMANDWFRKVKFSRELNITFKGREQLSKRLELEL